MKKLNLVTITALSITLLQACGGHKDSKAKADSVNTVKDTSTKPFIQPDSAKVTTAHIEVGKDDAKFAVAAMAGGIEEVELGKLAQQKASDSKVKDFGAMMVTDHTKANQELLALGQSLRIALPAALDKDGQKLEDELSEKSGADFDKAYVKDMVEDHKKDIKEFEKMEKYGKSVDLKAFATKTLPVLNKHLAAIQQISDSMK
jgi:putative membrane protein